MAHSIAIVSGRGGSGKTLVATALMLCFDRSRPTILLDGDVGTGGLSYFLGINYLDSIGRGLADYLIDNSLELQNSSVKMNVTASENSSEGDGFDISIVKKIRGTLGAKCVTVGNHRKLLRAEDGRYKRKIGGFIDRLKTENLGDIILIDCRGGIDEDSVAVCSAADEIILVVETDAAAIQSTLYLLDVLSENRLFDKVKGFILNKAFDDPAVFAVHMANMYRIPHLGSVPFDFETVRRYLHGRIPEMRSPFVMNIGYLASRAYPEYIKFAFFRPWGRTEYRSLTLRDPRSVYGGAALLMLQLALLYYLLVELDGTQILRMMLVTSDGMSPPFGHVVIVALGAVLVGVAAAVDVSRRWVGGIVDLYIRLFEQLFRRKDQREREIA